MNTLLPPPGQAESLLQEYLDHAIPLVPHMQVHVAELSDTTLRLEAPLAPNRNHIGTVFGGSLNALATLSCWGLVWLALHDRNAQIVIHEGSMKFMKPANGDFAAVCKLPPEQELRKFIEQFEHQGRARITLTAEIHCNDKIAARFEGGFAAMRGES